MINNTYSTASNRRTFQVETLNFKKCPSVILRESHALFGVPTSDGAYRVMTNLHFFKNNV